MARGKGEHSIYQRKSDGRWMASMEIHNPGGKRDRKVFSHKDKEQLITKLDEAKAEAKRTGTIRTSSMTVEGWLNYWLRDVAELRPKTMANYRSLLTKHVIPVIGKTKLDKLTPAQIRTVTDKMMHGTEAVAPTTAATAHRIMSSAFEAAYMDGRIGINPAKRVKAPRFAPPKLDVLTLEEARRLLALFKDNPAEMTLWFTFLYTGARRGEILGLTWDRVTDILDLGWQLQRHPVEIVAPADYEWERLSGGLYLTRPKSRAGWRVVPLVEPLATQLRLWHDSQPRNDYNLVFATPKGEPIDPDYASKAWPKILAAAGITKNVRLHDLRHSAVDMMYEAGIAETTITEIVGHSSRSMTRSYKSRGNRRQLTDAMTALSDLLGIEPPK